MHVQTGEDAAGGGGDVVEFEDVAQGEPGVAGVAHDQGASPDPLGGGCADQGGDELDS